MASKVGNEKLVDLLADQESLMLEIEGIYSSDCNSGGIDTLRH